MWEVEATSSMAMKIEYNWVRRNPEIFGTINLEIAILQFISFEKKTNSSNYFVAAVLAKKNKSTFP